MKLYKFLGNKDLDYSRIANFKIADTDYRKLIDGYQIRELKQCSFNIIAKSKKTPDIFSDINKYFIVSEKVKECMLQIEKDCNLKFIPIEIKKKTYYLMNVIENIKGKLFKNDLFDCFCFPTTTNF